jgi:hypothetical protein
LANYNENCRKGGDKMRKYNTILLLIVLLFSTVIVLAEGPVGPESVTNSSERFESTTWNPYNISAIAGNITSLNIHSWTLTRTWAGFYGNISGTIVLSDANNNTMYDWNDASPNGRVYASRDSAVTWSAIACANKTSILDGTEAEFSGTNITDEKNGKYPMDSPNATFVSSASPGVSMYANYSTFWVGPVQINGTGIAGECLSTVMHNSTGYVDGAQNAGNDPALFREVALADGSGNGDIVYTAILENDKTGFDGATHDFQMIVAENGHGTDTAVTQYYFYVELE